MTKVVVLDDEFLIVQTLCKIIENVGLTAVPFTSPKKALLYLRCNSVNAVIVDMKMPEMDGLDVLVEIKGIDPRIPVIIVTGYGNIDIAVKAIKLGAYDFLTKPIHVTALITSINRLFEELDISFQEMVGKSTVMVKIISEIRQVAQSDMSIILQGETGTGKTYLAKIIHSMSKRRNCPFIRVNLNFLKERLIESELFGHVKGSFSGANIDKVGSFKKDRGGTIFLDEIQNMSNKVQGKLLSVIDKKIIYPIGSIIPQRVDVRVISATNIDIQRGISERCFRDTLFYRLNEYIIIIPPLRERREDIEFFARKFISQACEELNRDINIIPKETLDILISHQWPGNIRELRNVIRTAVINTVDDTLSPESIDIIICKGNISLDALSLKAAAILAEKKAITVALRSSGGNKTMAAKILKVSYKSLLIKIKEFGI